MSQPDFPALANLLKTSLGQIAATSASTPWQTVLELVITKAGSAQKRRPAAPFPPALSDPGHCEELSISRLAGELATAGLPSRSAAALSSLAKWWTASTDPASSSAAARLEQLPGVSRELADRIRLFVLSQPVAPVGRNQMRVFCRHGWLDQQSEYDEWQSTLRAWARSLEVDLAQWIVWIDQLGTKWCGPKPDCADCPLRELLPVGGPIEPHAE